MNSLEQLRAGQLAGSKQVRLTDSGLTEFPPELFGLTESLELLDLSNSHLRQLPENFSQFQQLKILFLNNNQFEIFPEVLARCPQLSMVSFKNNRIKAIAPEALSPNFRWLILTNNQLSELPASIGQLSKLQKFMLAGNQLRSLPPEIANCHSLELIRIAANQLDQLPPELLTLPRLAWIAYAGNPFSQVASSTSAPNLPAADPATLEMSEVLGQGASGVIYRAAWQQDGSEPAQAVALKQFKGDITSDGSPLHEMQACIAAGNHPNLVSVLAKLGQADRKAQAGLLFELLPQDYQTLGGPPSLDSCTRDTYSEETQFTLQQILAIVQGIASVVAHLHQRGILHGDLYAHNILINPEGRSILSDFGAASFYDPEDTETAIALQQIEARAYGCLLEDLLDRYSPDSHQPSTAPAILNSLRQLQAACMSSEARDRPSFQAICEQLATLEAP